MAESSASPSSAAQRRPSTAGNVVAGRRRTNAEDANFHTTNGVERERPLTAPSGGPRRARQGRERWLAQAGGQGQTATGQAKRERGASARVVEARLDELRADEDVRATQTLLDRDTKAILTRRANKGRRARESRIRDLVSACRKHQLEQQLAARANQAIKDQKTMARRERAREARGLMAQTKGWLTALKMYTAIVWVANGLAGIEEEKRRSEAAKIITRHVVTVARHRFTLRLEAATRVIDNHFAKKIRRWKTKRDAQATSVLERFLKDIKSSNVRTKVKLLAYRVAHAHVQLARLQRWWRRRRQEMAACRRVMCRLWEQEVDRRVEAKVDEIWRARNEGTSIAYENSGGNHHHHGQTHHQTDAGAVGLGSAGALRWGAVRHTPPSAPSSVGSVKEFGHAAAARGERATIRHHLLLDPLMNPPSDLKVRMCGEYLKQMVRRHAGAVGEFEENCRRAARPQRRATKFGGKKITLLAVSYAVQARRQVLHAKAMEVARLAGRPRWRTGALPGEVPALVDAGMEYILGMRWLWEPRTPSRLDDGTLVADSMPTPEELAARVASKFRYGGNKLALCLESECASTLGMKGIATMTRHARFGGPDKSRALESAAQAGYAPAAAGWIGEVTAGSMSGGNKKRVAPLLTYHYLPPSSTSCGNLSVKNGS
eukprot:g7432.t1